MRLLQHFEESGLVPLDIPKALAVHEILGIGLLGGAWAACYHLQPTQRGLASFGAASAPMISAMEKAKLRIAKWSAWTSRVPLLRSADQGRLLVSLAESSVARKVIVPVTVPLKLWLSCYAVLAIKGKSATSSEAARAGGDAAGS